MRRSLENLSNSSQTSSRCFFVFSSPSGAIVIPRGSESFSSADNHRAVYVDPGVDDHGMATVVYIEFGVLLLHVEPVKTVYTLNVFLGCMADKACCSQRFG